MYVAGTLRLTTTAVDDAWSAGKVGVFRLTKPSSTTTLQWDNFKCGKDVNADGDVDDAGDYVFASFDFNDPGGGVTWQKLTLSYDNNGNLTADGLLEYRYDGWNRLVAVGHAPCDITDPNQWIASYKYLADNRRCRKVVQNRGVEVVANDGGNTTLEFYYDDQWRIVEERNGSNQAVRQYLWGTQYIDEIVWMDVNSVPSTGNDADPDVTTGAEGDAADPADERYYFHQDRTGAIVALTEYNTDPNNAANGRVVERYETHLGGRYKRILSAGSSELGAAEIASRVGNPFVGGGPDLCPFPSNVCYLFKTPSTPAQAPQPDPQQPPPPPNSRDPAKPEPFAPCIKLCYNGESTRCGPRSECICPHDGERCSQAKCGKGEWFNPKTQLCQKWSPPFGPIYGNCCGLSLRCENGLGSPLPGDCVDESCAQHDQCLVGTPNVYTAEAKKCHCDHVERLLQCPDGSPSANAARDFMIQSFCALIRSRLGDKFDCPACKGK